MKDGGIPFESAISTKRLRFPWSFVPFQEE